MSNMLAASFIGSPSSDERGGGGEEASAGGGGGGGAGVEEEVVTAQKERCRQNIPLFDPSVLIPVRNGTDELVESTLPA